MVSQIASHIASTLLSQDVFVLLDSSNSVNGQCLFLCNPAHIVEIRSKADIEHVFTLQRDLHPQATVAGYLEYEAGFLFDDYWEGKLKSELPESLGYFGVFLDSHVVSRDTVDEALELIVCEAGQYQFEMRTSREQYQKDIDQVLNDIRNGEYYQINYTVRCDVGGTFSVPGLYKYLRKKQPVEFGAWLNLQPNKQVLSFSPELFFSKHGNHIQCKPMKGTLPVGVNAVETEQRKLQLRNDEKNRAENVMIVDLLRNDLSRVCRPGSVRVSSLFDVEELPTVLQMTSTVKGELVHNDIPTILEALYPCGSITGAPKLAAMQSIRSLEQRKRGVYTGSIGVVLPNGDAEFSVAIRTLQCTKDSCELSIGSGIVFDSEASSEYAECLDKLAFAQPEQSFALFETMEFVGGSCALFDAHVQRLAQSALAFGVPAKEQDILAFVSSEFVPQHARERVRLTCGLDGRMTLHITELPAIVGGETLRIVLSDRVVYAQDPMRQHKTTQREIYEEDFQRAQMMGFDDMLYVNERGNIVETTRCNVVVRMSDGAWYTPPLSDGCLPGVYRQKLLRDGLDKQSVRVQSISLRDIAFAEELLVTNAVHGVRRVDLKNSSLEAVGWFSL